MRSDLAPLAFLLARSIVNGVRRAVSSPKRILGLLFSSIWLLQFLVRPFMEGRMKRTAPRGLPTEAFSVPDPATVEALVFAGFGVLSLIYLLGLLSYRGSFKPADVDVLFPLPISPKVVLGFRIVRDYLASLLLPLFVTLVGFTAGPSRELLAMFKNAPATMSYLPRAGMLAILLLSLFWVTVGYAASIATDRADGGADRNRKIIGWMTGGVLALAAIIVALQIRQSPDLPGFRAAMANPVLRVLLLPATAATALVMGPLRGEVTLGVVGGVGLVACAVLAFRVALSQSGWLYDSAAARGFDAMEAKELVRKGDFGAVMAENARKGKVKTGRISTRISRWNVSGGWALVWREAVIQTRSSQALFWMMSLMGLGFGGGMLWVLKGTKKFATVAPYVFLGSIGFLVYLVTMSISVTGFVEFLKKVDVAKPLPFSPTRTVFFEIVGKLPVAVVSVLFAVVGGIVIAPIVWPVALSSLFTGPAFALTLISTVMLVSVLFPDFEDPTQRSFRGLMTLVGIVIGMAPLILVYVTFGAYGWPMWLAAIPFCLLALGISLVCALAAGRLYADFNPSE